ncbi:MAG: response regulator, partial [Acidobacteria bacterium]|nr:response regulator [Acidobacteriota bacterium]
AGKGTGLGLAVVHGFVKQCGGHIEVRSELEQGTTFRIYLPRTDDPARPAPRRTLSDGALPSGAETILLVEDDDAVRALSKRVLDRCGYTVIESARADSAIRLAAAQSAAIHLLVTDVVMPGGGGRLLADHLQLAHPAMKVLYVSGYTDDAVLRNGVLRDDVNFLQKPFTSMALAVAVRGVLDRGQGTPGAA